MHAIYGFKTSQTQKYLSSGKRVPVTTVSVGGNKVSQIKTVDKDGYGAVQVGIGTKKREIRLEGTEVKVGDTLSANSIFKPGDLVNVTGISKGKGFAGVVKRHGFGGGPKTHGQSDRHRAPGSIGQTTTPGRVFKGKKMAGRMGGEQVTQRNLIILTVSDNEIQLKGLIPGPKNSITFITKVGEAKNFQPLLSEKGLDKEAVAAEQANMESQVEKSEAPEEGKQEGGENGNT